MASVTSSPTDSIGLSSPRTICQIVGYVCLIGFLLDLCVLILPPDVLNLQWRIGIIQQVSDRSIIFLFGMALISFGATGRRLLKQISRICLVIGALLLLACPLVIRDAVQLQQQAVNTITSQSSQAQQQIDQAKADPKAVGENVTIEQLQTISQQLTDKANTLMQSARTSSVKTGAGIISNLLVVGLGMLALGRYLMRSRNR